LNRQWHPGLFDEAVRAGEGQDGACGGTAAAICAGGFIVNVTAADAVVW